MTIFLKIIGRFRWLAFLFGAALVGLLSWLLWPIRQIPEPGVVTQTAQVVHDSSGIQSLRDSLSMMRSRTQSTRLIRVIVRDTINGLETVYLDSGSILRDTITTVHTVRDTVSVAVHDTVYRSISKTDGSLDNEFTGHIYYDGCKKPGARLEYSRRIFGPISGLVYADYQDSLESGLGVAVKWTIFHAQAVAKNYGYRSIDFGYKIDAGVNIEF